MRKTLATTLLCLAVAGGTALAAQPAATPTPLPEIYRVRVRPLCSALHGTIAPAIGMMLQNDQTIAKSPQFFDDYVKGALDAQNQDGNNEASGRQNIAVLRMENLVTPLVNNTLAIQKMLDDPTVFPTNPRTPDEQQLADIKKKMLTALADQQASLDIINGFVSTQQLSAMQHEGFGYIAGLTQGDIGGQNGQQHSQALTDLIGATPDPLHPQTFDNTALQAGIAPNPYELDLSHLPGLALGYNPVSRLKQGVTYTQDQSKKNEERLSSSVLAAARTCGATAPAASATPSP